MVVTVDCDFPPRSWRLVIESSCDSNRLIHFESSGWLLKGIHRRRQPSTPIPYNRQYLSAFPAAPIGYSRSIPFALPHVLLRPDSLSVLPGPGCYRLPVPAVLAMRVLQPSCSGCSRPVQCHVFVPEKAVSALENYGHVQLHTGGLPPSLSGPARYLRRRPRWSR